MPTSEGQASFANRRFLFLQGLSTPLFYKLGMRLRQEGAKVDRINICAGDKLFWSEKATNYRGRFGDWSRFLAAFLDQQAITDIVLFGDTRPYHRVAISLARRRGILVHVFDEGILRPHWISMETDESWRNPEVLTGASLPVLAQQLPAATGFEQVAGGFAQRAWWDVMLHACNIVFGFTFPFYKRHRPDHPLAEGLGWLRRSASRRIAQREAERVVKELIARKHSYFLLALQLDSDAQIRFRSPYKDMEQVLEIVLSSFAQSSMPQDRLVVKVHPLDNGLINRKQQVARIAESHGLAQRVTFVDGGHLPTMIDASKGVVVVNSTVGLTALHHQRPTFALADPIYALDGLTAAGSLEEFWRNPAPPVQGLIASFEKLLIHTTQINGSYFNYRGIDLAIDEIVRRLGALSSTVRPL